MFIQTEPTPNPATVKFIPGETVLEQGVADFTNAEDAKGKSPLAERLFKIEGVAGVFFGPDFVSVTKDDKKEWLTLKPLIRRVVRAFFHGPENIDDAVVSKSQMSDDDSDVVRQIKELLETRVRPAVARDGGDISFEDFDKGILFLRMQGACSGCPSSTVTLKMGIENMMRHYIPEVLEVRAVQD